MSIRKKIYPDDLEEKIRSVAEAAGFEYTHINLGRFPMEWWETYGFHSKDYIFDRFEPRTWYAKIIKNVAFVLFCFGYVFHLGLVLTVLGLSVSGFVGFFRSSKRERMVS